LKLLAHQKADTNYLENADLVVELARKAAYLFKKQNSEQKRKLINLIVSNSTYKDKKLDITMRCSFDLIMNTKESGNWLGGLFLLQ
jgi:site-specific DNA recombinase